MPFGQLRLLNAHMSKEQWMRLLPQPLKNKTLLEFVHGIRIGVTQISKIPQLSRSA